jgi:hypothetical protein
MSEVRPYFKQVSQREFQEFIDLIPLLTGNSKYEGQANRAGRYQKTFLFHVREVVGTRMIPDQYPSAIIAFTPGTGNRYFIAS